MAYCINCGQKLAEGSRFCANCGKPATENESSIERKAVFDGELHKCPNCGELLKSFTSVCPSCGYELRSVKTNSPVEALAKRIEQASSLDEKIELITNFYIPNTKEDIYDFFILAVSNLEDKWYDTDDAWRAKLEQAYHKARLSFGNSSEFDYLEKLYFKTRKEVSKRERGISAVFRRNKIACITALLIGGGIIMLAVGIILFASNSAEESAGAIWGGLMCATLGINFIISPVWVLDEVKKKELAKNRKNGGQQKNAGLIRSVGKEASDFLLKYYEDVSEELRELGFKNIVTKAEKKGMLDTEGAVKGISIGGNSEFNGYDEFDVNSKIIIRYYSKNYKG